MALYEFIMWEPDGEEAEQLIVHKQAADFNTHSQLVVHANQEAIFFKDGQDLDLFDAGKHTLTTDKLPLLSKIMNWTTGGVNQYHSEVYFINKVTLQDLRWGTPAPFEIEDPEEKVNIRVRCNGVFGTRIEDGRKLLRKVVGTKTDYTKAELTAYLKGKIVERVKTTLSKLLDVQKVGILHVTSYLEALSDELLKQLKPFFEEFGIALINFSFNDILPLDEDLQMIREAKRAAKKMDLESEALARKREREGYSYQQERSYDVLEDAASNKGQSSQFMGAGMGLGMGLGVGGAFGAGMAQMGQNLDLSGKPLQPQQPQAKTIKCASCGAELPEGSKFCNNCGKEVINENEMICPKCGAKLPKGSKFCNNCGAKLVLACPKCGAELAPGSKFCNNCGEKVGE